MSFSLSPLPYDTSALEPAISKRTLEFHHGKHHAAYVKKLNALAEGTPFARMSLPEIVQAAADDAKNRKIFNNAGQIWNHDFFWLSMRPDGGGAPGGELARAIERDFGSLGAFEEQFVTTAAGHFGSGWAWLVVDGGKLRVKSTHDGEPAILRSNPLLTCDLWEHAYYLDYQNDRKSFIEAFLAKLANWEFAAERFAMPEREEAPAEATRRVRRA